MVLRLLSVHHRYGRHSALRDVSLHVRAGDCYGFIGHNGAGKTTAMRLALGLVPLRRGRILVEGFDAQQHPREARARMGGLIEQPRFHGGLGGRANLELLARAAGQGRAEARREAGRVLERVGLSEAAERAAGGYSQGMRQRLGIAQALLGRPRLVVLDEPTNGLDPQGIADMRALFAELVAEGTALWISSHQLHELEGLCNRVAVLRQGQLVVEAPTEELLASMAGRYRLHASDPGRVPSVLEQAGIACEAAGPSPGDGWIAQLGERPPEEVLRALVDGGVEVRAFAPAPPSLEEIVLQPAAQGAEAAVSSDVPQGEAQSPSERVAPGGQLWRAARYEARRLARPAPLALLSLPLLAGLGAQVARWRTLAAERAQVEAGELFGTTAVTGFEAVGVALQAGLPLLALVVAGLASQSLAGELARGTLRNLLLLPLRREAVAVGKGLALMGAALAAYLALVAASLVGGGLLFDFGDVVEILPDGTPFPMLEAAALWPELWRVLPAGLLPILACAMLGLAAGALLRSSAGALALSLGALAAVDVGRALARPLGWEDRLLTALLPSPLGDRSAVAYFVDFSRGVSNPLEPIAQSPATVALTWLLPLLGLAGWRLVRRSVP